MTTVPLNSQRPWQRPGLLLVLLLAWTLFWFRDTASAMVGIWWRSDTFTHGFLVVPIVLWLVWHKRKLLSQLQPKPNAWGLGLLALTALAWLLGDLVAMNALTQLALVTMLIVLVFTLLGTAVTRTLGFALAFLFFAVPFGEFAMPQLMQWTAYFTVQALRLTGIPVYNEGLQFVIPSGSWSVIEACSGVRYLIASLTVGTLFAYINYQSLHRRLIFVGVSIIVPVIANWMRAYLIVMLGHVFGNQHAVGVDHLIYGWLFFGVVILLMFIIGTRWAEPEPRESAADINTVQQHQPVAPSRFAWVAVAAAVLVTLPIMGRWALINTTSTVPPQLTAPATLSPAWSAVTDQTPIFKPAFQNPSASINTTYVSGNQRVGLYVGYYRHQNYDRKLVSSDNVLVQSRDTLWAQVSSTTKTINFDSEQCKLGMAELRYLGLSAPTTNERLTVWKVYWMNGTLTASDIQAKVYGALYRLIGQGDDSAVVILYTPKGAGDEGQERLQSFVQANAASILSLLEKTKQTP
jgi:exosortase A